MPFYKCLFESFFLPFTVTVFQTLEIPFFRLFFFGYCILYLPSPIWLIALIKDHLRLSLFDNLDKYFSYNLFVKLPYYLLGHIFYNTPSLLSFCLLCQTFYYLFGQILCSMLCQSFTIQSNISWANILSSAKSASLETYCLKSLPKDSLQLQLASFFAISLASESEEMSEEMSIFSITINCTIFDGC